MGGAEMTIDELARRAGTTSRNIRAYQERGVLPPPRLVGRTGYYSEGHVARLRHIAQLLERGFSLAAIRELFAAWERGYGLREVLGFEEALDATWAREQTPVMSRAEIRAQLDMDDVAIEGSVALGLLEPVADGYRVRSPRLLAAGRELTEAGIPLVDLITETARLQEDMERIAERWVALYLDRVWTPYVERGMPPEELPEISAALNRLRPLAVMTVEPLLAQAMERRVAAAAAERLTDVRRSESRSLSARNSRPASEALGSEG